MKRSLLIAASFAALSLGASLAQAHHGVSCCRWAGLFWGDGYHAYNGCCPNGGYSKGAFAQGGYYPTMHAAPAHAPHGRPSGQPVAPPAPPLH